MMKKILIIALAILLVGGMVYAATPGRDLGHGAGDVMGQGKYDSTPHKTFRLVRYVPNGGNANSPTMTADSVVIWDTKSDDGVTVTTTTKSGDSAVAGIIVQDALTPDVLGNTASQDSGKRNWTWLQTYGLSQADFATGTVIAEGGMFGTSDVNGLCGGPGVLGGGGVTATATNIGHAGFVYDAVTSGATDIEVFLKCE